MRYRFEHKNFNDKILITLFVNNKKADFVYKMVGDYYSSYDSIKHAEEQLLKNYQLLNEEYQESK